MSSDTFPRPPEPTGEDQGVFLGKSPQPPEWTTPPSQSGMGASPYPQTDPGPSPYGAAQPQYTQPRYGHPQYAQPQYGQQPYGYGRPSFPAAYASWLQRVGAFLLDALLTLPGGIVQFLGLGLIGAGADSGPMVYDDAGRLTHEGNNAMMASGGLLILLGSAIIIGIQIWNRWIRGGRGASWGKKQMGLRLVNERTGQPIGAGGAFVRDLAHFFDGVVLDIGYLWPLWDPKHQTFSDKICSTVVVRESSVQQHPQGYGY